MTLVSSPTRRRPVGRRAASRPRTALVLGVGGRVGLAHHAGTLMALDDEGVFRTSEADLVIGTSAGAIVGAQLRSGVSVEHLYKISLDNSPGAAARRGDDLFAPAWDSIAGLAQRAVGSAWVVGRCALRLPLPPVPRPLRQSFPGGLMRIADHIDLHDHLPAAWPSDPLWLATVDIRSGRRVVLRRDALPRVSLHQAVLASSAVPGVYQPVRAGGQTLVDGGVHSSSNLDLISQTDMERVIVVAPLGLEKLGPVEPPMLALRSFVHTNMQRQVKKLRAEGREVLVIEPSASLARLHGTNTLRVGVSAEVAAAAHAEVSRRLANGALGLQATAA